jgi:hypothetical protein
MTDLASLMEKVRSDLAERRHMCALTGPCSDNGDGCSCAEAALAPPIKAGEAVPVAIETLLDELERGVVSTGLHEDNETELFDIDEATEAMYQASVLIRVLCARTSPQPKAYGVKPLEWGADYTDHSGYRSSAARSIVGSYEIYHLKADGGIKVEHGGVGLGTAETWDAAKAAAQADYSARILSALSHTEQGETKP